MLLCRNCGVLVGALYRDGARVYAVVNASAADAQFGKPQPVSPRTLGNADKVRRWKDLWFSEVAIQASA